MCVYRLMSEYVPCGEMYVEENLHTWLKNRQTAVGVSKHQFALFVGVPSEETDIRQEGVGFFMHRHPGVSTSIDPDIQRTTQGHKRHAVS